MHSGYVAMTARVAGASDLQLTCTVCGRTFIFAADEQQSFIERGFQHPPKRCKKCMARRSLGKSKVYVETRTNCANCGVPTIVPFVPSQGRPVLCHTCFKGSRDAFAAPDRSLGSPLNATDAGLLMR